MEGNRDESEKCVRLATKYLALGDKEKAIKFLNKAEKLYPSQQAKDLLSKIINMASTDSEKNSDEPSVPNGNPPHTNGTGDTTTPESTTRQRKTTADQNVPVEKQYSQEQLVAVRRIRKCKDYYEILGVTKDCSEDDLKKAYKKLALKFHPDKNKAPGATEAFKAIGNALAVLTNTEKRRRYDQYGTEADRVPRHSHGTNEYDYSRGFEGDISAEELFNMFFGGAFQPGHSRRMNTRHSHTRTQFNTTQDRSESSNNSVLLRFAPVLFVVFLSVFGSYFAHQPVYILEQSTKYSHERKTHNLVIPYYVKPGFSTDYKGSIRQLEQSVEEDYLSTLRSNCFRERSYKENMLWRARNFHDSRLYQKAQDMKTPSCDRLQNIYGGA